MVVGDVGRRGILNNGYILHRVGVVVRDEGQDVCHRLGSISML